MFDATRGGSAPAACLLRSIALCDASIAAMLSMADGEAAAASTRSQRGDVPGTVPSTGALRERYTHRCEEPYPFGRAR